MNKLSGLLSLFLLSLLALAPAANAETYSLVDEQYLPIKNINDPIRHQNVDIIGVSFEQLDEWLLNSPSFNRWNDPRKVCEAMQIMFGRVSSRCLHLEAPKRFVVIPPTYVSPIIESANVATTTAKVTLTLNKAPRNDPVVVKYHTPRPKVSQPLRSVVSVNPVYNGYGGVYRPYGWY